MSDELSESQKERMAALAVAGVGDKPGEARAGRLGWDAALRAVRDKFRKLDGDLGITSEPALAVLNDILDWFEKGGDFEVRDGEL